MTENIKWNGPNYCYHNEDRITMRIQPMAKRQIQIIFHRGAKKQEHPKDKLIKIDCKLLIRKEINGAIMIFKNLQDIESLRIELTNIARS